MKNIKLLAYLLAFLVVTIACEAPMAIQVWREKGEVNIVYPEPGAKFTYPDEGSVRQVDITINSTFPTPKDATIITSSGSSQCRVEGGGKNTPCGQIPLQLGQNTVVVQVLKVDNQTVVSSERIYFWAPYSPLDLGMQKIAGLIGKKDPIWGYNMVAFLIAAIIAIPLSKMGNTGAIVAFAVLAFGFAYFAPVEITALLVKGVYGAVIVYFVVLILRGIKHVAFVKKGDFAAFYGGQGGEDGATVVRELGVSAQKAIGASGGQPRISRRNLNTLPPLNRQSYLDSGDDDSDNTSWSE